MKQAEKILELTDIDVAYNSVTALKGINFDLFRGEIHALIGNHRAGKSSLAQVISGAVPKQRGHIFLRGREIDNLTPQTALARGIGMIYQQLNLIPSLNAVENIFAGTAFFQTSRKKSIQTVRDLFCRLDYTVDLTVPVKKLSRQDKHMVEVARLLALEPDILIFDELSNKLNPDEMKKIYPLIFDLKRQGKSIIYITHNIDEIFELADRVTILKAGQKLSTEKLKDIDKLKLINLTYSFVLTSEELKKESKKLFYFRKYNESIIKNIPVGVIILDNSSRVYLTNYAARTILGSSEEELQNRDLEAILPLFPSFLEAAVIKAVNEQEELSFEALEWGGSRTVKLSIFPFKDDNYVFLGTIILVEDISRDVYLKEYALRMEKISSIAELAAGVAHEINNPLGIVSNYIELIKHKKLDEDSRTKLHKIEKEINRISLITGGLLSFSRSESIKEQTIDLTGLLDEVCLLLEHKINSKQIGISKKYTHDRIILEGDENKLIQLFMNLLINAIEAVNQAGLIVLEAASFDTFVQVKVIDDGPGISASSKAMVFAPFYSTKSAAPSGKKNAGLGLSICQHIVDLHEGIIDYSDNTPRGTCFMVRLPVRQ